MKLKRTDWLFFVGISMMLFGTLTYKPRGAMVLGFIGIILMTIAHFWTRLIGK